MDTSTAPAPAAVPFGSWQSPVTAESCARSHIFVGSPQLDGGFVYWLEGRPLEGGRHVLVRGGPGVEPAELTGAGFNVRTKVHEYGGGSYTVHDGVVWFSNFDDQRIYRLDGRLDGPGATPAPITSEPAFAAADRFADGRVTPDGAWLVCVRERHTIPPAERTSAPEGVVNEIVAVPADGQGEVVVLVTGRDFYAFPRISPDGTRLAWTEWSHPNLPWDGTDLYVADLAFDGILDGARHVAGGPAESVQQPAWNPDGTLHFISDSSGWWNLYAERDGKPEALAPMEAEFADAQWVFGLASYAFLPAGRILCSYRDTERFHLAVLEPGGGLTPVDLPFTYLGGQVRAEGDRVVLVGASPTTEPVLATGDLASGEVIELRRSSEDQLDPAYISAARTIEFPTDGGVTAFANYYAPCNPEAVGPEGALPPLVVVTHGGPTGRHDNVLDPEIQFWTTRGFAVVDVNYGGSTGYGRAYRERLNGQWGVVDTVDCVNAARHLVERGLADPARLAIRGGSAGGWTTLCALVFHDDFAVGADYFGVADLETFATDTHKFESRYLDNLVGALPDAAALYEERSPARHLDRLSCPVIVLQGLEDEVVPPSQSEMVVHALDAKQIPYAYLGFQGEQHGFRRAENIERALEAELYFYGKVLGFQPADRIKPVEIAHADKLPGR